MELFRCERMSATISRKQCDINRKGRAAGPRVPLIVPCFACAGCPGLGVAITIEPEEVIMASICKILGCGKQAQHGKDGMCRRHFTESRAAVVADPRQGRVVPYSLESGGIKPDGVEDSCQQGVVTFGTDLVVLMALRDAWSEKERKWLADLSGLRPGQTLARAVLMVNALEGLGY